MTTEGDHLLLVEKYSTKRQKQHSFVSFGDVLGRWRLEEYCYRKVEA